MDFEHATCGVQMYGAESPSGQCTADSILLSVGFQFSKSTKAFIPSIQWSTTQFAEFIKDKDERLWPGARMEGVEKISLGQYHW